MRLNYFCFLELFQGKAGNFQDVAGIDSFLQHFLGDFQFTFQQPFLLAFQLTLGISLFQGHLMKIDGRLAFVILQSRFRILGDFIKRLMRFLQKRVFFRIRTSPCSN